MAGLICKRVSTGDALRAAGAESDERGHRPVCLGKSAATMTS